MDQLLELAAMFISLWRVFVGAAIGLVVAAVGTLLHPLPAGVWFSLAFIGAASGAVLQVAAASRESRQPKARVAEFTPFQVVLFLLVVAVMGGSGAHLVEPAFGEHVAVASALVVPLAVFSVLGALAHEPLRPLLLVGCSLASLLGYLTPQAIEWLFARAA